MTRMLELSGSDAVMKELPKQMIGMMEAAGARNAGFRFAADRGSDGGILSENARNDDPDLRQVLHRGGSDGLIAFYESPLGKKMASTQPLILKEVMGVVPQWAAEFNSKCLRS